jgi:hypothetical protein
VKIVYISVTFLQVTFSKDSKSAWYSASFFTPIEFLNEKFLFALISITKLLGDLEDEGGGGSGGGGGGAEVGGGG